MLFCHHELMPKIQSISSVNAVWILNEHFSIFDCFERQIYTVQANSIPTPCSTFKGAIDGNHMDELSTQCWKQFDYKPPKRTNDTIAFPSSTSTTTTTNIGFAPIYYRRVLVPVSFVYFSMKISSFACTR